MYRLSFFKNYRNYIVSFIIAFLTIALLFSILIGFKANADNIYNIRVFGNSTTATQQSQQQADDSKNQLQAQSSQESYISGYEAAVW